MSDFLPIKAVHSGSDVTALSEAASDDVLLAPGGIKFGDGSVLDSAAGQASVKLRTEFALATADQLVFPFTYNPDFVIVIRNGATLLPTRDYTATDGTTLTLIDACDLDDEIAILTT
jgi:hypothetical protein